MKHGLGFVNVLVVSFCWIRFAEGATLVVPDQIASVSEAVNLAVSGDTILVKEHDTLVDGTLVIKDKDLLITGPSNESRAGIAFDNEWPPMGYHPTLQVENARVTFRFLCGIGPRRYMRGGALTSYAAGPIEALSGALIVQDCTMYCSIASSASLCIERCSIFGDSGISAPRFPLGSTGVPPVRIHDATGIKLEIIDSILRSDHSVGVILESLSNVTARIENCLVQAGSLEMEKRVFTALNGSTGMYIFGCRGIQLEMPGTVVEATDGRWSYGAAEYSSRGPTGGHGLWISDSTLRLVGGQFIAGVGVDGQCAYRMDPRMFPVALHGGHGGHGLCLSNAHVLAEGLNPIGGKGGASDLWEQDGYRVAAEAGDPGLPISMDASSTYQELSRVPSWENYSQ